MSTDTKAVTEIYHAKWGASGIDGWINCPAWEGGGAPSIYAAIGSVIHEIAAECLTTGVEPASYIGRRYTSDGFDVDVTPEHMRMAYEYVTICQELHAAKGGTMLVEQTLPIDHITGEYRAKSTLDFGIVPGAGDTELLVADLKTGSGVAVNAEGNGQARMYALAMLDEYSLTTDIKTVRMLIVQPSMNSVSEWVQTVDELEAFRERVKTAMTLAMSPSPTPIPGTKQCRWCAKKAVCKALNDDVFEAVDATDVSTKETSHLVTDEQLAEAMARIETIEAWTKAVRAEVERRLLAGQNVEGWKLVQGKKGNRMWVSKPDAEELFKQFRIPDSAIYEQVFISPTSAEKLVKEKVLGPRQWEKVQELITQTEGKPSVAQATDKRPAIEVSEEFESVKEADTVE